MKSSSDPIPLIDLAAQYDALREEIDAAVAGVVGRHDFVLGESVAAFEREFADLCGTREAVGCASGQDALHLALRAAGLGPGDEVLVPAFTFVATALGVTACGATPVLVDIDPHTALIDLDAVEAAVGERTRAVIPVHLFGQCVDMDRVEDLARRHGLVVIEDAAQAHGADAGGRPAGSRGAFGCFSFYPSKNLGAYGDAGAVVTHDAAAAERLRRLRNLGSVEKYHHEEFGLNSRLDTIQAAVLRVKLPHLRAWNAARAAHAARYDAALAGIPGVELTRQGPGAVHHLYVIRVPERDRVLQSLHDEGIGAAVHYPLALHETGVYKALGDGPGSFPVAERWARRCISLPVYPELPADAPERAARAIRRALAEGEPCTGSG